jgi:hypothetical protein
MVPAEAVDPVTEVGQPGGANEALIAQTSDVIATVGDQAIHFGRLTKELDQGAVPGVSVPGYGTPERKQILMRLLDDAIRSELLYLDARQQGVDRDPAYRRELGRLPEAVLAGLFRERQAPTGEAREQWREGIAISVN